MRHPKASEEKRQSFQQKVNTYQQQTKPIIYIDESGFAHDMPRTHGYALKGKRCFGDHHWNARGRTNVIGALLAGTLLTCWLCDFNVNSDVFHAWIINDLLPKLPENSVLIMDNATFHKRADTQQAIQSAGHTIEYLPPYSPDLNPIEHKWAQTKAMRRKIKCSVEKLFEEKIWNQN